MPLCKKCKRLLEYDWVACPYCGTSLIPPKRGRKNRGNGTGTAYQRGRTWTAKVTLQMRRVVDENGKERLVAVSKTKGGFRTKTEALNYCDTLRTSPNKVDSKETFRQVYDRWIPFYESRIKASTMACYKAAFSYFSNVQNYRMTTLTVDDLQACVDQCDKGRSTKDDMKSICSLLFKYAISKGIVEQNLAQFLFVGKEKKGKRPAFSMEELDAIKNALGKIPYADYVYFLCYTGFRPNEFLSLKKEAFHTAEIGDATICFLIGGFKTEAGTDRIVTISPKVQPILDQQMENESDFIFPNLSDGRMMTDEYFRKKCFLPLMEQLNISGKVPYSCRHTFANLLKNVYGSDIDKAKLIGHADASMTKYYQSADYASMKAITDIL